ncbi:hypothetical protein MMC26_004460 [Xylographa opegraphella]|nr:hypothetical protein [Xylographa opegraphella]
MLLWAAAGVPLGIYNIVSAFNVALRVQPQILTLLSLATWMQCCYYGKGWAPSTCLAAAAPIVALCAGAQAGLIVALRVAVARGVRWPVTLMAVLSAALLAAGVLRHYWDIYTHRTVRGISFVFVGIDAAGDLFSLVSVFFEPALNVQGMAIYGTELALWIGVFACGGYFNLLPWVRKGISERQRVREEQEAQARETGITLQDLPSSTSVFRTASEEVDGPVSRGSRVRSEEG